MSRYFFFLLTFLQLNHLYASIDLDSGNFKNAQLVTLNLQLKSNNKLLKSELLMPFYQKAEFEKKIEGKKIFIEMTPRYGKNSNEISLELKLFKKLGARAFYKKDLVAKINEELLVKFKGASLKIKPLLN